MFRMFRFFCWLVLIPVNQHSSKQSPLGVTIVRMLRFNKLSCGCRKNAVRSLCFENQHLTLFLWFLNRTDFTFCILISKFTWNLEVEAAVTSELRRKLCTLPDDKSSCLSHFCSLLNICLWMEPFCSHCRL